MAEQLQTRKKINKKPYYEKEEVIYEKKGVIMNFQDYNVLGSLIDDTFGKSNDTNSGFKCAARITKENRLTVTCMVVVNLLNRSEMNSEAKKAEDQLSKLCNSYMKNIKKDFKLQTGRALKAKQVSNDASVELVNMSSYSPKGTSLVRQVTVFDIS